MTRGQPEGSLKELKRLLADALRDRYTLDRVLGAGGMAIVFAARDLARERPVAIKVMRPEIADAVATTRFVREILWSSRLQHPHIVPLLDSGDAAGFPFAVMPLIEGETLASRLGRAPPLPMSEALRLGAQVASALAYAHEQGVVHRDIKPDNILLSHGYALVADFGVARALGLASTGDLTGPGSPIGTLAYMSPEQAAGRPDVDGRTDIYSLACVVFEMLAGRPAVEGSSLATLILQRGPPPAPPLRSLRPDVPEPIADAIARCLDRDPARRIQTAQEFAAVLEAGATGAAPPAAVRSESRAGIWLLAAAAVAVVALLLTRLLAA